MNGHVAVRVKLCSIVLIGIDRNNGTGNKVLAFCVGVVTHQNSKAVSLGKCQESVGISYFQGYFELFRSRSCHAFAGCCNRDNNFSASGGNGNGEFSVSNNSIFTVRCPRKENFGVSGDCCRKVDNCIRDNELVECYHIQSISNLLVGSFFNLLTVYEAICANGHKVNLCTVIKYDTGYVCCVTKVCCVLSFDLSLCGTGYSAAILVEHGIVEVGEIRTEIRGLVAQLEVEVIGRTAENLFSNFNALNGYRATNVLNKGFACSEFCGYIQRSNCLLVFVNDSCRTALNFLHCNAVFRVRRCGTGNFNGHTNFNTEFKRVNCHFIGVITAIGFDISEEEVIALVAGRSGVHSNNNTLNNNGFTRCSVHIFFVAPKSIFGNSEIIASCCGFAIAGFNGSGQFVCYFFRGLFINVDGDKAVLSFTNSYLVSINGPLNGIDDVINFNLSNNCKVSCCNSVSSEIILVENVKGCSCLVNVIGWCGGFFFFGSLGCSFFTLLAKITRSESCEHQDKYQCEA